MRKSKQILSAMLCLALVLCACGKAEPEIPTATATPTPAAVVTPAVTEPIVEETPEPETIYVASTEELFAAIGSDRTIVVQPGEYDWPYDYEISAQGFTWTQEESLYGNPAVVLSEGEWAIGFIVKDVHNLTIRGVSDEQGNNLAAFSSSNRFTDMLAFEYCSNIVVESLDFSREWDGISFAYGHNLALYDCENVTLRGVRFVGGGDGGMSFNGCKDILFDSCTFTGISSESLFAVYFSENVGVNTSRFEYNGSPQLEDDGIVRFQYNEFIGNLFEEVDDFGFDGKGFYTGSPFVDYPVTYDEVYALEMVETYFNGGGSAYANMYFEVSGTEEHDGEAVYLVRAYEDMGTHIVTLHWFYVGMETGRLWEWSIASDQTIEILF